MIYPKKIVSVQNLLFPRISPPKQQLLDEDLKFMDDLFWEEFIKKIKKQCSCYFYALIIERRAEGNYRCKKCGWFFSFYAQHPLQRPKQCPKCRTRNPLD